MNPGGTLTLSVEERDGRRRHVGNFLNADGSDFAVQSALGFDTTNANFTYSGSAITGNMGLTKLGNNTLTLTGVSTFAGPTLISGGTLQLGDGTNGHDGSLPSTGGGITDNATLVYNLYGSQADTGVIGGSGSLLKAGNGTLSLLGSNTFTGPTSISGGTLQLGNGTSGHDGSLASVSISNSGALVFDIASSQTYAGAISGTGNITKIGTGSMTFSNTNSNFTGLLAVNAGLVEFTNPGAPADLQQQRLAVHHGTKRRNASAERRPVGVVD